jgi:hypothetical protein
MVNQKTSSSTPGAGQRKPTQQKMRVLDGRAFAGDLKQRSILMVAAATLQNQLTTKATVAKAAKRDPLACGMAEMRRIFDLSKVTPVQQGQPIPPGAHPHVIFFGREELTNVGATLVEHDKKGLPLGNPHRTAEVTEDDFVYPIQKKLYRQRRQIFHHLMDDLTGSGNLLSNDESYLRGLAIFEQQGDRRCFVWCGDDFM